MTAAAEDVRRTGTPESAPVLAVRDLTRVHSSGQTAVHALRGLTLSVAAGEMVAVMGPSGSGKSTLLSLAGGLDTATSGEVLVEGEPLSRKSRSQLAALRRRSVGYVFQDFNLLPALTAVENVALPRELLGTRHRDARTLAVEALAQVGLQDEGERRTGAVSGGQQQRAAVARALVHTPGMVFADEPTGALDTVTGERVLELLLAACSERAASLLLVTHDHRVAAHADRLLVIRDGAIGAGETA